VDVERVEDDARGRLRGVRAPPDEQCRNAGLRDADPAGRDRDAGQQPAQGEREEHVGEGELDADGVLAEPEQQVVHPEEADEAERHREPAVPYHGDGLVALVEDVMAQARVRVPYDGQEP
jgi:hypothetical protein